jgi:hypothetical protein
VKKSLAIVTGSEWDLRLAEWIAFTNNAALRVVTKTQDLRPDPKLKTQEILLLDVDLLKKQTPESAQIFAQIASKAQPVLNVVWVSKDFASAIEICETNPILLKNWISRRSSESSLNFYAALMASIFESLKPTSGSGKTTESIGFTAHLASRPGQGEKSTLRLRNLAHRKIALQALNKVLTDRISSSRVRSLLLRAFDELLINALSHAPVLHTRTRYRKQIDLTQNCDLLGREEIQIDMLTGENYQGIQVTDLFGSLDPKELSVQITNNRSLAQLVKSGLSLHIEHISEKKTAVAALIPIAKSVKELKKEWSFFSLKTD